MEPSRTAKKSGKHAVSPIIEKPKKTNYGTWLDFSDIISKRKDEDSKIEYKGKQKLPSVMTNQDEKGVTGLNRTENTDSRGNSGKNRCKSNYYPPPSLLNLSPGGEDKKIVQQISCKDFTKLKAVQQPINSNHTDGYFNQLKRQRSQYQKEEVELVINYHGKDEKQKKYQETQKNEKGKNNQNKDNLKIEKNDINKNKFKDLVKGLMKEIGYQGKQVNKHQEPTVSKNWSENLQYNQNSFRTNHQQSLQHFQLNNSSANINSCNPYLNNNQVCDWITKSDCLHSKTSFCSQDLIQILGLSLEIDMQIVLEMDKKEDGQGQMLLLLQELEQATSQIKIKWQEEIQLKREIQLQYKNNKSIAKILEKLRQRVTEEAKRQRILIQELEKANQNLQKEIQALQSLFISNAIFPNSRPSYLSELSEIQQQVGKLHHKKQDSGIISPFSSLAGQSFIQMYYIQQLLCESEQIMQYFTELYTISNQ